MGKEGLDQACGDFTIGALQIAHGEGRASVLEGGLWGTSERRLFFLSLSFTQTTQTTQAEALSDLDVLQGKSVFAVNAAVEGEVGDAQLESSG